jgi:hypothetical protein
MRIPKKLSRIICIFPTRTLVLNYASSSGTHPRTKCDRTVYVYLWALYFIRVIRYKVLKLQFWLGHFAYFTSYSCNYVSFNFVSTLWKQPVDKSGNDEAKPRGTRCDTAISLADSVLRFFRFWPVISQPNRQGLDRTEYPRGLISVIVNDFFK